MLFVKSATNTLDAMDSNALIGEPWDAINIGFVTKETEWTDCAEAAPFFLSFGFGFFFCSKEGIGISLMSQMASLPSLPPLNSRDELGIKEREETAWVWLWRT